MGIHRLEKCVRMWGESIFARQQVGKQSKCVQANYRAFNFTFY